MMQRLDEPRSVGHRTEQETEKIGRKVSAPVVSPGRIEMPTHPAMPRLRAGRLRFAPAPIDDSKDSDRPAISMRLPRPADWVEQAFEAGWVGLMAACAAECAYRLL